MSVVDFEIVNIFTILLSLREIIRYGKTALSGQYLIVELGRVNPYLKRIEVLLEQTHSVFVLVPLQIKVIEVLDLHDPSLRCK